MNAAVLAGLAALPIILAGVLLVGFRLPAKWAMPAVYVTAAAVALGEAARAWLEQVDILGDLGALRREMVDHILELQSWV